jgi:hypothetical protein
MSLPSGNGLIQFNTYLAGQRRQPTGNGVALWFETADFDAAVGASGKPAHRS